MVVRLTREQSAGGQVSKDVVHFFLVDYTKRNLIQISEVIR